MHRILIGILLFCFLPTLVSSQEQAEKITARGNELLSESRFEEAEALFEGWAAGNPQNPDAHFYLALSRALQNKLEEALSGFRRVVELDSRRADAHFEIAGVLLRRKDYREALGWAARGLRLDPESEYGLDLAGSLSFLLGSKLEALDYWNRLDHPHLTEMTIISGPLNRYRIVEEIDLNPGELISPAELDKASWRLGQHDYIRRVEFSPVPGPSPDEYALEVRVDSRSGFGSPWELIFHSLGEIAFDTLRVSYWNFLNSGTTFHAPFRWSRDARWFQFQIDSPRPLHYPLYVTTSYDWRDESWVFEPEAQDPSFRLRTHELGTSLLFPIRAPRFAADLDISYRWRDFDDGMSGANNLQRPYDASSGVLWLGTSPALNIYRKSTSIGWVPRSDLIADLGIARLYGAGRKVTSRLSLTWKNLRWRVTSGWGISLTAGTFTGGSF